jgi:hypothetical protein
MMGGRAGFVRARGGWCSLGELTADFWGIRLVRACLEDIWASVCSASKQRTPPDKGWPIWQGFRWRSWWRKANSAISLEWHLGAPYPVARPSLSIKAHSDTSTEAAPLTSLAPGFSALAHTGTGAGARRRGPLPSWGASLSHCLVQSDKFRCRWALEAAEKPTAGRLLAAVVSCTIPVDSRLGSASVRRECRREEGLSPSHPINPLHHPMESWC